MTIKHQRLLSLIEFVKKTQKISETSFSDVSQHEWWYFEDLLKDLPGVYFNLPNDEKDLWLVVERSSSNDAPSIENNPTLKAWLDISNDYNNAPSLKQKLSKDQIIKEKLLPKVNLDSYSDHDFMTLKDFLNKKPTLKEEFDHYLHTIWYPWTLIEKKRLQTRLLYKKLYELEQEFKNSEQDFDKELVLGLGIVVWKMNTGKEIQNIRYPLITHTLELNMNSKTEAIEITAKGKPQFFLDLYNASSGLQQLEIECKKWQQTLDQDDNHYFSPYDSQTFDNILRSAAIHLDAEGKYLSKDINDQRRLPSFSNNMQITDTWVIFLRPRGNESLLADLEQFQEQLQKSLDNDDNSSLPLPLGISALLTEPAQERPLLHLTKFRGVYCQPNIRTSENNDDQDQKSVSDLYFTMPSNEEQLKIIQKLESYEGLVIQGPPGTGKTHTISNIISHYLTLGKRVLITSTKKTALNVLRNKLLPSIRPLAVSLLSNEQEDRKQLEHSITIIKSTINSIDEDTYCQEIDNLTAKIDFLHEQINAIERKIEKLMQQQLEPIILNIDNSFKTFTPSEAACFISQKTTQKENEWLLDRISIKNVPLFSSQSIDQLRLARISVAQNLNYYQIKLLEIPVEILDILNDVHKNLIIYNQIQYNIDTGALCSLVNTNPETYQSISNLLTEINQHIDLINKINENSLHFFWHQEIEKLLKKSLTALPIEKFNDFYQDLEKVDNKLKSDFLLKPVTSEIDLAFDEDVMNVIYKKTKGKSGFGFLPTSNKKTLKQKIKTIKIINNDPKTKKDWEHVYEYFQLQQQIKRLITVWNTSLVTSLLLKPTSDILSEKLFLEIKKNCDHYYMLIQKIKQEKYIMTLISELLPEYKSLNLIPDNLEVLQELSQILKQHNQLHNLTKYVDHKEKIINFFTNAVGDIFLQMRQFIEKECGNPSVTLLDFQNQWNILNAELNHLHQLQKQFVIIEEVCKKIEDSGALLWAQSLRSQPIMNDNKHDPLIPSDWVNGWVCRQLEVYLEQLSDENALQQIEKERFEKINDLKKTYEKIVEFRTWLQVFQKMNPNIESALQSFMVYINKIGKGTGTRAASYRYQANNVLKQVIESQAIPCFIMPHNKISEILPSQLGTFDLVIIDEASQSDITSLPSLLRAEKILIVGDDKQVGPNDSFYNVDKINNLSKRLLHSQVKRYKGHISAGISIYELFQVVFAHEKIMLKEHFRSVAPIIEYSNREFYYNQIKPMRSPKMSERLDPPLIDVLVTDGCWDNTKNMDINKGEALFILKEIKKICNDPGMKNKTIGIVTLKGDDQADYITELINTELSANDIKQHKIKCGNARVFQGEERNIMFISLVVSFFPHKKKPFPLTKEDAKQRFNVAASRARDRMYLVRSIELNSEQLSSKDVLRRNLISHFKTPFLQDEKIVNDLRLLCESDFEKEMYDILIQHGYRVIPQLKVGHYQIDMVVEGDYDLRLAIECDGDKYYNPKQNNSNLNKQRILERNGWQFYHVFASNFFKNKQKVIQELINYLEQKKIKPTGYKNLPRNNYTLYKEVNIFEKK